MDPRSLAPTASSLAVILSDIAKTVRTTIEKYNSIPTTQTINEECSIISVTLKNIQSLLNQPHSLSSRVVSQIQLKEAFQNAQNSCYATISALEREAARCIRNRSAMEEKFRFQGNEALIRGLLQQITRYLSDILLLITAKNSTEAEQLLSSDTFIGDLIDVGDPVEIPTPSTTGGYSQVLWEQLDPDSKSLRPSTSTSRPSFSPRFRSSEVRSILDDDGYAESVLSKASSGKSKKVPRPQMGSIFFKLFSSNTDLHRAASKGDAKKIKTILDLGVDINYEGSSGCTALHLATDCGHEAVVRVLLNGGADPKIKSTEGRTPLHSAARTGHTTVVRLLLEKGADVRAMDPSGSTALHIAAYNGHESVVQILLEKFPFVEIRGPSGFTALHVASYNGQSAVVRQLVEMGAQLEARSGSGRTALQLAAEKGHEAVVRHLLQHGANIMAKDHLGRTAIQSALLNQHAVVAQMLVEKVVPDSHSDWQHQRSSISGPTYEMGDGEPTVKIPELDSSEMPAPSRRVSKSSAYAPPESPVLVELPASEMMAGPRSPSSLSRRTTPLVNRRRLPEK